MTDKEPTVYDKIRNSISGMIDRRHISVKRKLEKRKSQEEYWKQLSKDAEAWRSLLNDNRYPQADRFLQEVMTKLNEQLLNVLTGGDDKEFRVHMASVISGQIKILELIANEPTRVIDLLKEKE